MNVRTAGLAPSRGVIPGAVQVPAGGSPIVLLADAQTVGGYPVAGVVPTVDLPMLGQLRPGASCPVHRRRRSPRRAPRDGAGQTALVEAARLLATTEDWHAIAEDMA